MNSIWNKNIQSFEQRFPSLKELFQEQIDFISSASEKDIERLFSFWKIFPAKNNSLTVEENNLKLHSSYNPEREALQSINQPEIQNKNTVVFLGFGLGYQVVAWAKNLLNQNQTDKKLILIESDPLHFFAALYYLDWQDVFKIQQLVVAVGCPSNSIMSLLENSQSINTGSEGVSSAYFFTLPAFTAHDKNYFETVKTLIERNKTKNDINSATYDKFAKLWIKNSFANLKKIKELRTINQISIEEKNNRFLLVGAGPSLEKNLFYIKEIQSKITIVCVETALKALLNAGISPDFILLTDPQYYAFHHIAGLKAPESTLICPISVYPATFRFKCKEIILCSDLFPISQFYENKVNSFGDLGAGGSVASSVWNFCQIMGAEEIYFTGLDLSYPAKETHIRGSSAEQTFHLISSRIKPVERSSINSMYSAYPEYGINYKGEKVLTDSKMKMFAWWFESRIAACPEIKNYSLNAESLLIPGVEYKEKIEFSENSRKIKISEKKSAAYTEQLFSETQNQYEKELNHLINCINLAVEKCMINSTNLENELQQIQLQIQTNQLKEIINLASPSSKYMDSHKTNPPQLAFYQKLQKEIVKYKSHN